MHSAHDLATRWPALEIAAKGAHLRDSVTFSPGPLEQVTARYREIAGRAAAGLFRRDASVWTSDPSVQQKIANRLGWLKAPALMADAMPRLQTVADAARRDQMSDVVLLGMGGSSLAPEVLRAVLGVADGVPRFQMIDSTDPAAVRAIAAPPERTLYILASKSGTTIEPNSLAAHFRRGLEEAGVRAWARHFIAITDEGTDLAARARREGFRDLFINPADIGGRYSALSFFGLVPAALMGQDVAAILGWGLAMLQEAEAMADDPVANPAVALALAMGAGARAGGNKATLLLPPALEPFGLWIEQLVAESTGKQQVGIVPIAGEAVGPPDVYGADRLFIHVRVNGREDPARARAVADLRSAGAPIVTIDLAELTSLGAEFVRWEIATAVASAILDINPFDEPNVQQAKDATRVLLERFKEDGQLPHSQPDKTLGGDRVAMTLSREARRRLIDEEAEAFLTLIKDADYFALLAYLGPDPDLAGVLDAFRHQVRDRTRAATMFGYGPRYLHSTGQLHKGGPNTGVFVIVTAKPLADLAIPGEPFTFATLELAQAIGDFQSLDASGRRALHVHLSSPDPLGLAVCLRCPAGGRSAVFGLTDGHAMQLGFVGLGKMGFNMVTRLRRGGHDVVAFDASEDVRARVAESKVRTTGSLAEMASALTPPRAVWVMVPAGEPTESVVAALADHLSPDDVVVDGGNTNYHDDIRRAGELARRQIHYVDAGTSGGVWGLEAGFCLMVGGKADVCRRLEPLFHTLAAPGGYLRVGETGAGHYVKMVHNGIEYGLMQAYAEGFQLMDAGGFELDLPAIASLWMQGSVVRSWLLGLAARALADDPRLSAIDGRVADSGEGRWTVEEAVDRGVPLPVITAALYARFESRADTPFANRLLAALRHQFGGHAVKRID